MTLIYEPVLTDRDASGTFDLAVAIAVQAGKATVHFKMFNVSNAVATVPMSYLPWYSKQMSLMLLDCESLAIIENQHALVSFPPTFVTVETNSMIEFDASFDRMFPKEAANCILSGRSLLVWRWFYPVMPESRFSWCAGVARVCTTT